MSSRRRSNRREGKRPLPDARAFLASAPAHEVSKQETPAVEGLDAAQGMLRGCGA
jgi:hypothetical protein